MTKYETVSIATAKAEGLQQMTNPYVEKEHWMLDNVITDMNQGSIHHRLVLHPKTETHPTDEISVWR